MRIDVRIDGTALILKLRNGERRLAFGVAKAINDTALRIQTREVADVRRTMTVRRRTFIARQAAIIKPFANAKQGRPYAEIAIGTPPRLLLSVFERGGVREPFKGKKVAVPLTGEAARPTFQSSVTPALEFRRLRLSKTRPSGGLTKKGKQRRKRGGLGVRFGLEHTYQIPDVGVFQRKPGGASKLLYAFVKAPRLRPRLRFVEIAQAVAARWFGELMEREKVEAFRRAGFR